MKPITDPIQAERYRKLLREMMQEDEEHQFNPDWLRSRLWKAVPVEEMGHLPPADIPQIVSVLNGAGHRHCLAVATEPLGDMPTCYLLSVDEADFLEFNRELGPFRFLLTTEDRSWAISCTEWYNLFAGKPEFLETLLGKPIERARQDFLEFASLLAKGNADDPLLRVAKHYASL